MSPPPDQRAVLRLLLAGIGVVYGVAFSSLAVQVEGLVGSGGILPNAHFFSGITHTAATFADVPSVCWGDGCGDGTLLALCAVGALAGGLLVLGCVPLPAAVVAWAAYLSLFYAGQAFLSFQWDLLLLESGFLAILAAPPAAVGPRSPAWGRPPPRVVPWLFRWLLFRLVFASGVVKLSSGDPAWRELAALSVHYETQPLPFVASWWVHQLPDGVHRVSTAVALGIELIAPWLLLGPRRARQIGAAAVLLLMLAIAATGNYGFFNLLTAVLCLSVLDDRALPPRLRARLVPRREGEGDRAASAGVPVRRILVAVVAVFLLVSSLVPLASAFRVRAPAWAVVDRVHALQRGFRVTNGYGLFATMTTSRPEISVQGSDDGQTWREYAFPYKPDDPSRAPRLAGLHMPRLDWQLWFAALRGPERSRWFRAFAQRLLEGTPEVRALLAHDPFPDAPPRHLRAVVREYRFTDLATRRETGRWWDRGPPRVALELRAGTRRE